MVSTNAIRFLSKGYLPISLLSTSKYQEILNELKKAIQVTHLDYDMVLKTLSYYVAKLATFGINDETNLIIYFPIFIQQYSQKQHILYQIEKVPLPIVDLNEKAN